MLLYCVPYSGSGLFFFEVRNLELRPGIGVAFSGFFSATPFMWIEVSFSEGFLGSSRLVSLGVFVCSFLEGSFVTYTSVFFYIRFSVACGLLNANAVISDPVGVLRSAVEMWTPLSTENTRVRWLTYSDERSADSFIRRLVLLTGYSCPLEFD